MVCLCHLQEILRKIHPASLNQFPTSAMLGGQLPAPRRSRVVTADVFFSTRAQRCEPLQVWIVMGGIFLCFPEKNVGFRYPPTHPFSIIFKNHAFFGWFSPFFFFPQFFWKHPMLSWRSLDDFHGLSFSLRLTVSFHLKMDGWKTIRLPFGNVYFQGRTVSFRGVMCWGGVFVN